ncbi:hypothetical protein SYJ56_24675 [Algoriphagus sp. D3-2-R+10]|uniref:hypothetical protein n=1 Tax=Algoriphagus aurantiacus TaxID=3103948 RepID=UPI002B392760|nr:hypothetical protein [Algoriphagus sp. D3-2-R+10]MEB2778527.1 hypothetical protein [Algoriphagus sp. D3-2-R+10]
MGSVFVVFSGEYLLMKICSKQLEGNLPVFRIEGVFSDERKCKEWIESYSSDKTTKLLSYLEIPIDPEFGQKESQMEVFNVRMNGDLQILEISLGDSMAIPDGKLFTYEVLKSGEIVGSFWARDFIDACKLAYIRVQETMQRKDHGQDCMP